MRTAICVLAAMAGSATQAETLTEVWRAGGFASPESATYDPATQRIIVSQLGVFGPDGGTDGALGLLSPSGEVIDPKWVTGLVDPKGIASLDGKLYVADATGVQVVDSATGQILAPIALEGALLPNDVAVGEDGAVYVSDMMGNGIYRIRDGAVDQVVAAGGVPLPNGLFAQGGAILVGSFGDEMTPDFKVKTPGGLLSLDPASGTVTPIEGTAGSASVDGIASVGDWLVFDDNPSGRIMGWKDGTLSQLGQTEPSAADLSSTGDLLIVPFTGSGEVVAYRIE